MILTLTWNTFTLNKAPKHMYTSSGSLVGLVVTKSNACYLLGGAVKDFDRIPLGSNFSGSTGGVFGHA